MPYIAEPYDEGYYVGDRPEGYTDYFSIPWWPGIADDIEKELEVVSGKDVLEVGGGLGDLAEELRLRGADVTMIEYSAYAAAQASSRFPLLTVQQDDVQLGLGGPPNRYDLIVCLGVHDCMTDSEAKNLNSELNRLLRPQGSAYILFDTYNEHYNVRPNTWWASEGAAGFPGKNVSVDDVGHLPLMYGGRMAAKD